jgi:mannose-6-phosphate isomerase-like protein (cupin superfamily)
MEGQIRRIVTGHDAKGKAVVLFDSNVAGGKRGVNTVTLLWATDEFPVDMSGSADRGDRKLPVPPARNATVLRVVEFGPQPKELPPIDHHAVLHEMGIDPATQGYVRHAFTHRTRSIDYAIVLEGEIDMLLDNTQVHVKAGDILVQQATNHAWVNNSGKPCRICFVLIDGAEPPAWKQGWKP